MSTLVQKRVSIGIRWLLGIGLSAGYVAIANTTASDAAVQQCGLASFYSYEAGPLTANGEAFDPWGMTAASRTLPFGTIVTVTRDDGRSVVVRINDRGPFVPGRIIDLSLGAATALGMVEQGVVHVCIN